MRISQVYPANPSMRENFQVTKRKMVWVLMLLCLSANEMPLIANLRNLLVIPHYAIWLTLFEALSQQSWRIPYLSSMTQRE